MTTSISKMLVLLAAFAVTTPAATTLVPTSILSSTVTSVIKGRVVTDAGVAVEGARVQILRDGVAEPVTYTRSAADGSYELTLPSTPGVYTLRVLSIGFTPETFVLTQSNGHWAVPSEVVMHPIPTQL
jgi:hypothetical protein